MLIWSANIIQVRNTDIATKQYSHSSNSVLHKVQSPPYNTQYHKIPSNKPEACYGMHSDTIQYLVTHNTVQSPHPTGTPIHKGWDHAAPERSLTLARHTEMASGARTNTSADPAGNGHSISFLRPVLSWSPSAVQPVGKQQHRLFLQQVEVSQPSPPIRPPGSCC